jgi:AraC-like DNA-binding protein
MLEQFTLGLIILISCTGIAVSLIIGILKTVNPFLNRLLSATLLIMAWPFIQTTLISNLAIIKFPCLYGAFSFLYYLTPVAIYFYVRALLFDETRFYKTDIFHLIPSLLQIALSLPFLFGGYRHQLFFVKEIIDKKPVTQLHSITILPQNIALLSVFIVNIIYIFYTFKLISKRKQQINRDQTHQFIILQWAKTFALYFCVMICFMSINAIKDKIGLHIFDFIPFGGPLLYFRSILYSMIILRIFKTPELLFGLPNFNQNMIEEMDGRKKIKQIEISSAAYYFPNTNLSEFQIKHYTDILEAYMNIPSKPYLQQPFTLKQLSQGSGIPLHHLAYIFRYHMKESFVDYRNRHRLSEAINKIQRNEYIEKTLEAIGRESGFSSRTTFFNVFLKQTGLNPSEFIERMNNQKEK